ncbi:MAG TPA: hypothetical protein VGR26_16610, partial [Acidimicrobiales bacterium]|nr:hypothetical protein [Acidimicrobiales bacterium]
RRDPHQGSIPISGMLWYQYLALLVGFDRGSAHPSCPSGGGVRSGLDGLEDLVRYQHNYVNVATASPA